MSDVESQASKSEFSICKVKITFLILTMYFAEYYGRYYGRNAAEADAPEQASNVESQAAKSEFVICDVELLELNDLYCRILWALLWQKCCWCT